MSLDLMEEMGAIAAQFERVGIDYAICGGIAVAIHGFPRATQDLDILIREEDLPKAETAVGAAGFTLSSGIIPFDVGKESERRIFRISKVAGEELLTLDLVLVTPALEAAWKSRLSVKAGGMSLKVVSREGLTAMKRLAGRPVDQADIENLEKDEAP